MQKVKKDALKAGVVGAAIGATAVLLSEKKNRDKVSLTVNKLRRKAKNEVEKANSKTQQITDKAMRNLEE